MNIGEVITRRKLLSTYDRYAEQTLGANLLKRLPREKRGEQQKFEIIAQLPTADEYALMKNAKFTCTIIGAVEEALSLVESVKDELQNWHDSMPESFQQGEKGDAVQSAIDALENVETSMDFESDAADETIMVLPLLGEHTKQARLDHAVSILEECASVIRDTASEEMNEDEPSREDFETDEAFADAESDYNNEKDECEARNDLRNADADKLEEYINNIGDCEIPSVYG